MRRLLPLSVLCVLCACVLQCSAVEKLQFPFKEGDRVAWIGSSSTKIGIWCDTLEFLLKSRHPELKLTFSRHTTGGGTFVTGLQNMEKWLAESKPTIVFLNYGGNDANAGENGLPAFKENMEKCVEAASAGGARVWIITPQSADVRKSGVKPFENRKLYAETMIAYANEMKWPIIDVHHPLEKLQLEQQKADDSYTINKDNIHLNHQAYVAWGLYMYDAMNPPAVECAVRFDKEGKVESATASKVEDFKTTESSIEFTWNLANPPKGPLPPAQLVPSLKASKYVIVASGGQFRITAVSIEGKSAGSDNASGTVFDASKAIDQVLSAQPGARELSKVKVVMQKTPKTN